MPLKEELNKRGIFHSDTDTEVLVNLIEEIQKQEGINW
jgi:glucosamine--fructose-6-phosphate aminotransferase (isomerizing)